MSCAQETITTDCRSERELSAEQSLNVASSGGVANNGIARIKHPKWFHRTGMVAK